MSERRIFVVSFVIPAAILAVIAAIVIAVQLATPPTRVIDRPLPTSLPARPAAAPVATVAPRGASLSEVTAFAQRCGHYLRQVNFDALLALQAPDAELFEYRQSVVFLLSTYGLYRHGEARLADVLTAYTRYDRAIDPLLGGEYTILVAEGCWPKTILGERYEPLKNLWREHRG